MSKITPGKWQSQDLNLRSAAFLAIAAQVSTMRYRRYLQRGRPCLWSQRHPHGLRIRGKGPAGGTMSPFQVITRECRLALLSRPSVSNMYPKKPLWGGALGGWAGGRVGDGQLLTCGLSIFLFPLLLVTPFSFPLGDLSPSVLCDSSRDFHSPTVPCPS